MSTGLNPFSPEQRLIIKIGSALLVEAQSGILRKDWLASLCADIKRLKQAGREIIIVSSGAIALGQQRLGLYKNRNRRPLNLTEKQACAAAGQPQLTLAYENALGTHELITAQALLTLQDTEDRRRWLNARSTLETLLELGVIPIINENDTVATDEIRYGDNDRLAARTAQMLGADSLILLSDIDGLYNCDPRQDTTARHLPVIEKLTPEIISMGGAPNPETGLGSGGMASKLLAAKTAIAAGCHMCIMDGTAPYPLTRLEAGEKASWFAAQSNPDRARRQWISGILRPMGQIKIDTGAVAALVKGKSLLAAGVTELSGTFRKGDAIIILDPQGQIIGRGLSSYDSHEVEKILGLRSADIATVLGYDNSGIIIHRDNMVLNDD